MRVPVAAKAFAVFLCTTAVTVVLGSVVYMGLSELQALARRVDLLREFQVHVGRLGLYNRSRLLRAGGDDKEFQTECGRVESLAAAVASFAPDLPPGVRPRVRSLAEQAGYYRTAFGELFEKHAAEQELRKQGRETKERLHQMHRSFPPDVELWLHNDLQELAVSFDEALGARDMAAIPGLRNRAQSIAGRLGHPKLTGELDRLVLLAEKVCLNYLGIADREKFVAETASRFFEIADETARAISARSRARQRQLTGIIWGTLGAALLLTIGLWSVSRRYIRRFLTHMDTAIRSIQGGRYDYPVPAVPDDETGDLTRFMKTLAGDLQRSLQQLRDSEERYRSLIEGVTDWVWEVDRQGAFVYSSPVAARLLGYEAPELAGRHLADFVPADQGESVRKALEQALVSGTPGASQTVALRRDGRSVVLESSFRPVYGPEGTLTGLLGISRDVTERWEAEAERARLRSQLLQAQKMEAVGTLTGGIAHDFNNLLQSVTGCTELLLQKKDESDPDYPKLKTIERAAERAADLTRKLLVFGRKAESRLEPLNLNAEVVHVRDLLERTIPKMISIETHLAPDLWTVRADPTQLEQIMVNLALNAKDAMPDGGTLTFATENSDRGPLGGGRDAARRQQVRLRVSDTGHGMDAATVEHIFEPFFTTKELGKGTGLGLAIVYGIVEAHGGRIDCRSRPGEGTVFDVWLPAAAEPLPEAPTLQQAVPETLRGTETVLLVDDEEVLLSLGAEILGQRGYTAVTARTGEEALAVLGSRNGVDVVVLDLNMPGMGGVECLHRIRQLNPLLPVLVASGQPPGDVRRDLLDAGAAAFVRKPFRAGALLEAVRKALDGAA